MWIPITFSDFRIKTSLQKYVQFSLLTPTFRSQIPCKVFCSLFRCNISVNNTFRFVYIGYEHNIFPFLVNFWWKNCNFFDNLPPFWGFISAIMVTKPAILVMKNKFHHARTHFNPQIYVYFWYSLEYKACNLTCEFL